MSFRTPRFAHRDARGVSPVIATILLVAITVVLAAVLYVMVSSLLNGASAPPPPIIFTDTSSSLPNTTRFQVSGVGPTTCPLDRFELHLLINGVPDTASAMVPVIAGTRGNLTYEDADGRVTIGDAVVVHTAPGRTYEILLLWKLGGISSDKQWTT